MQDIFQPNGRIRGDLFSPEAGEALQQALAFTRATRWETVRSPHIFMGLLAVPDSGLQWWGEKLKADLPSLLRQFQDLFLQEQGNPCPTLDLTREFFSDNVLQVLRKASERAEDQARKISSMDLLISLLTAANSIIAECFERIGVTAAQLTEIAMLAEEQS